VQGQERVHEEKQAEKENLSDSETLTSELLWKQAKNKWEAARKQN